MTSDKSLHEPLLAQRSARPGKPSSGSQLATPLSSAINLTATAAGTGMLTLPFAFARCGPVGCLAILAVLAVTTDVSLVLLVRIGRAMHLTSFGAIMQRIFGDLGSRTFQAMMSFILFFALTAMQRVVLDLLPMFLEELLGMSRGSMHPLMVSGVVNCGVLASCMSDTFHGLRFSSGAALACLMPFVLGIFWKALGTLLDTQTPRPEIGEGSFEGLVLAPPLLASSLLCHFGILDMDAEMQPRFREYIYTVIHWVTLIILPLTYALVGIAGIVVLGADTGENVLMAFEGDRLMQFARGVLSLTNALRMPLMVKPLLSFARELARRPPASPGSQSGVGKVIEVSLTLIASMCLAQWMMFLTSIMGLLGGTAGVVGCYCVPGLMYLGLQRVGADTTAGLRSGAYLVIAVGALVVLLQPMS